MSADEKSPSLETDDSRDDAPEQEPDEQEPGSTDGADGEAAGGSAEEQPVTPEPDPSAAADKAPGPTRRTVIEALVGGIVVGAIAGFGGGYWYANRRRRRRPRKPLKPAYVKIEPHNPRKGPEAAKVTIIEFSEFECPFCAKVTPTIQKILAKYQGDVALVFKHQPLEFHKHAMGAAIALQAAHRQNKAWELHDILFENRENLSPTQLPEYAKQAGLDLERFEQDMADPKLKDEVKADQAAGDAAGATGTPSFFINGRPLRGAAPLEKFVEIIDEELKRADELIAAGTPLGEVYAKRAKELVQQAAKK